VYLSAYFVNYPVESHALTLLGSYQRLLELRQLISLPTVKVSILSLGCPLILSAAAPTALLTELYYFVTHIGFFITTPTST
jgi:hypothetical protein